MTSPIVENIQQAVGDSKESLRLHQQRNTSCPPNEEAFHRDCRINAALQRKTSVAAALVGCCAASSILSCRRSGILLPMINTTTTNNNGTSSLLLSFLNHYLILPVLTPVAVGFGLALFRSTSFEREFRRREKEREEWELQNYREGEVEEMIRIYQGRGLSKENAEKLVAILNCDDKFFIDAMMSDELGFSPVEPPSPREALRTAALCSGTFLSAAVFPLFIAHVVDHSSSSSSSSSSLSNSNKNDSYYYNLLVKYSPEIVLALTTWTVSSMEYKMLPKERASDKFWSYTLNSWVVSGTYALIKFFSKK